MKRLARACAFSLLLAAACGGPVGFVEYPTPGCASARASHEHLLATPGVLALGCGECPNTTRESLIVYVADDPTAERLNAALRADQDGVPCCALVAHFLAVPKQ